MLQHSRVLHNTLTSSLCICDLVLYLVKKVCPESTMNNKGHTIIREGYIVKRHTAIRDTVMRGALPPLVDFHTLHMHVMSTISTTVRTRKAWQFVKVCRCEN